MKLNVVTASFTMLDKALGLPEGVHVVGINQDPLHNQFYIRIASENDPKPVSVDDMSKLGLAFGEDVPEEMIYSDKGSIVGGEMQ